MYVYVCKIHMKLRAAKLLGESIACEGNNLNDISLK